MEPPRLYIKHPRSAAEAYVREIAGRPQMEDFDQTPCPSNADHVLSVDLGAAHAEVFGMWKRDCEAPAATRCPTELGSGVPRYLVRETRFRMREYQQAYADSQRFRKAAQASADALKVATRLKFTHYPKEATRRLGKFFFIWSSYKWSSTPCFRCRIPPCTWETSS